MKYETTHPVSTRRRPVSGKPAARPRVKSAPVNRPAPASISKKDLHRKSSLENPGETTQEIPEDSNAGLDEVAQANGAFVDDAETDQNVQEKPPMSVKVKKSHPMDKFVEDLRLMNEMETDFKKSTLQLQKKLGLETSGFVY